MRRMWTGCCLLVLGWGVLFCGAARAEVSASEAPAATAATATAAADYHLQVGDYLAVTTLGENQYSGNYVIRSDGSIQFSDDMVGTVTVVGLTIEEATKAITTRVAEYVKDPSVSVLISRFRVMVVGEVQKPGQYDINSGLRLADAVQQAGGALDEKLNLPRVYVHDAAGQEVAYDLWSFQQKGDTSQNPVLSPGDSISVGRAPGMSRSEYRVSGAVRKAGYFPIDQDREVRVPGRAGGGGAVDGRGRIRGRRV